MLFEILKQLFFLQNNNEYCPYLSFLFLLFGCPLIKHSIALKANL